MSKHRPPHPPHGQHTARHQRRAHASGGPASGNRAASILGSEVAGAGVGAVPLISAETRQATAEKATAFAEQMLERMPKPMLTGLGLGLALGLGAGYLFTGRHTASEDGHTARLANDAAKSSHSR